MLQSTQRSGTELELLMPRERCFSVGECDLIGLRVLVDPTIR